jgi:pseudouridine-5'-phosphate glycosidase
VDRRFDALDALAAAVRTHLELRVGGGVVVANPIPAEHELPRDVYDRALRAALAEADRADVKGRDITPFLLERLRVLTDGASVASNRALLRHNAAVAGRLAAALSG